MVWDVVFYMDVNGSEPVKDFVLAQSDGAIAEILHVFKLLREFNITLGRPYVEKVDDSGIRELRIKHGSDIYRIFFFAHTGKRFILLHAIIKKQGKLRSSDVDLAIRRMVEYQEKH
jgi:phage-related protein